MQTKPKTHGEAYATNYNGYRDKIDAFTKACNDSPIRTEVARLQSEGMTGEQAWTEVLKRVTH